MQRMQLCEAAGRNHLLGRRINSRDCRVGGWLAHALPSGRAQADASGQARLTKIDEDGVAPTLGQCHPQQEAP